MAMNSTRFNIIFKALPIVVQKVYEGVPAMGAWDATDIHKELVRRGIARDLHNTKGALKHLVDSNMVLESSRGFFTRAPVRGAKDKVSAVFATAAQLQEWDDEPNMNAQPVTQPKEETEMTTQDTTQPTSGGLPSALPAGKPDPIDQLTKLSARVMIMSGQLKELANDIENAALDITEQMAVVDENTQKLKQLQALLKGLV